MSDTSETASDISETSIDISERASDINGSGAFLKLKSDGTEQWIINLREGVKRFIKFLLQYIVPGLVLLFGAGMALNVLANQINNLMGTVIKTTEFNIIVTLVSVVWLLGSVALLKKLGIIGDVIPDLMQLQPVNHNGAVNTVADSTVSTVADGTVSTVADGTVSTVADGTEVGQQLSSVHHCSPQPSIETQVFAQATLNTTLTIKEGQNNPADVSAQASATEAGPSTGQKNGEVIANLVVSKQTSSDRRIGKIEEQQHVTICELKKYLQSCPDCQKIFRLVAKMEMREDYNEEDRLQVLDAELKFVPDLSTRGSLVWYKRMEIKLKNGQLDSLDSALDDFISQLIKSMTASHSIDKGATFQLGEFAILKHTDSGLRFWKLEESWTPTIYDLQCSRSLMGFLTGATREWTIRGFHLDNAILKASNANQSERLTVFRRYKTRSGTDVVVCKEPNLLQNLAPMSQGNLYISALKMKTMEDGESLVLYSEAKSVRQAYWISVLKGFSPLQLSFSTVIIVLSLALTLRWQPLAIAYGPTKPYDEEYDSRGFNLSSSMWSNVWSKLYYIFTHYNFYIDYWPIIIAISVYTLGRLFVDLKLVRDFVQNTLSALKMKTTEDGESLVLYSEAKSVRQAY